jgi:hypothetical protein
MERVVNGRIIKTFRSTDGRALLHILKRADGLYSFEGKTETEIDGFVGWIPSDISGLYGTADEADRDARATVVWLRDQTEQR